MRRTSRHQTVRLAPTIRRQLGNVAGFAAVSAFWLLLAITALAPQP